MSAPCRHGIEVVGDGWDVAAWVAAMGSTGSREVEIVGLYLAGIACEGGHLDVAFQKSARDAIRSAYGLSGTRVSSAMKDLLKRGALSSREDDAFHEFHPELAPTAADLERPEVAEPVAPAAPPKASNTLRPGTMVYRFNPRTGGFDRPVEATEYLMRKAAA